MASQSNRDAPSTSGSTELPDPAGHEDNFMSVLDRALDRSHLGIHIVRKPNTKPEAVEISDGKWVMYISCTDQYRLSKLKTKLNDRNFTLVAYDVKEVLKELYRNFNICAQCEVKDPAVAESMLDNQKKKSLEQLALKYTKKFWCEGGWRRSKALIIIKINDAIELARITPNMKQSYTGVEMPFQKCLAWMELAGCGISFYRVAKIVNTATEYLKLPIKQGIQDSPSSFKPTLKFIISYRKILASLVSQYRGRINRSHDLIRVGSLNNTFTKNGVIYKTNFNRLPPEIIVRKNNKDFDLTFQNAWAPGRGRCFLAMQFSHFDLSVLALLTKDETLKQILSDGEKDVYTSMCSTWHGIPVSEVTPESRKQVQELLYCIMYEALSCKALAKKLGVSEEEAAVVIQSFNDKFSNFNAWISKVIEYVKLSNYTFTYNHRRTRIRGLSSSNPETSELARKKTISSAIQGTLVDIFRGVLVIIDDALNQMIPGRRDVLDSQSSSPACHLVVHLNNRIAIYEVDEELVDPLIYAMNCTASVLPLPMKFTYFKGNSWDNLEEVIEEEIHQPPQYKK